MRFLLLLLCLFLLNFPARAASFAENSEALIGIWDVYDANNVLIDSLDIKIAIAKNNTARFSYTQESLKNQESSSLQGYLLKDTLVWNFVNLAYTQNYIAKIDFDLLGGPGVQVKTQLATCTLVGKDNNLVKVKHQERLADDTKRCDYSVLNDTNTNNIRIVKRGSTLASIPSELSFDTDAILKFTKLRDRIEGAWALSVGSKTRRFLIKDLAQNYLGYSFKYKIINNNEALGDLSQDDFLSGLRTGYLANNFMILNTSRFSKPDELYIIKLLDLQGQGRELANPNGDCFPLKNPVENVLICTPNSSSAFVDTVTERKDNARINKLVTDLEISF